MADIAGVEISRLPAIIALGLGAAFAAFVFIFRGLLYDHEIAAGAGAAGLVVAAMSRMALLRVKGDPWRGEEAHIIGTWTQLQAVRAAIIAAQNHRRRNEAVP